MTSEQGYIRKTLLDMRYKILLEPKRQFSIIVGAWLTISTISQFNWAHDHNHYDDIGLRLLLACLIGVGWGILYFSFGIPFVKNISRTEIHSAQLIRSFAHLHLPFYGLWLYFLRLQFPWTGPLNQYLPYIILSGFLWYFLLFCQQIDATKVGRLLLQCFFFLSSPKLRVVEELFLLIAPILFGYSVREHLSSEAWYTVVCIPVLYFVWTRIVSSQRKNAYEICRLSLFIATNIIFICTIWSIYNIDSLLLFPDTHNYVSQGGKDIFTLAFWFIGERPFVTPSIFRILQNNWAAINDVYIIIYLSSVVLFEFMSSTFFLRIQEKLLICYALLLLFSNQQSVNLWLSCALSEIPSIVLTLFVFSLFGLLYVYREHINKKGTLRYFLILLMAGILFFFSFSRDSNMYFLPCLLLFGLMIFRKLRDKLIITVLILLIFGVHNSAVKYSDRWKLPLANVLMWRILPDQDVRQLFQSQYHLPPDDIVMPCSSKWAYEFCEHKEALVSCHECNNFKEDAQDWVSIYGLNAYKHFLFTHPTYVFGLWMKHWDIYNADLWWYADEKVKTKKINDFMFAFPGHISFLTAFVIVLFGIVFFKKYPLILLFMSHACVIGIVSLHGDVMEFTRHYQQAAMTLKIAYVFFVCHAYSQIITTFTMMRIRWTDRFHDDSETL